MNPTSISIAPDIEIRGKLSDVGGNQKKITQDDCDNFRKTTTTPVNTTITDSNNNSSVKALVRIYASYLVPKC